MQMMKRFPSWIILVFGMVLGSTLTSTLTFHLWWCEQRTLNFVREQASIPLSPQPLTSKEHCVCGEALEALQRNQKDQSPQEGTVSQPQGPVAHPQGPVARPQGPVARPQAQSRGLREEHSNVDVEETQAYPVQDSKLAEGLSLTGWKEGLVVAVLSARGRVEWAESVYDTWGRDATHLRIFVSSDKFNHSQYGNARGLPLVLVKGEGQSSTGDVNMILSVVQYLSEHHLSSSTKWFLIATENSYIRLDKLKELLVQLNPKERLYLGRSATGRKGDVNKLGLQPHERYCLGSSGIVLSSALLSELSVQLGACTSGSELPGDVALGKCISRALGIQCAESNQTRNYFFEDYSGEQLTDDYITKREVFQSLITYHPVPSPVVMATLHQHYKRVQFSVMLERLKRVQAQLSEACSSIATISAECVPFLCSVEQDRQTDKTGVISSLSSPYLPTTIYDFTPWIYFDATTLFPDQQVEPSYKLKIKKNIRQELKQALTKAVQRVNEQNGRPLKFKRLVNGWMRHNPFVGNEYIFDMHLTDGGRKVLSKRMNLVRPLGSNYITRKDSVESGHYINMVVPLTNVGHRFEEFMQMYEELALVSAEKVRLILSVYGSDDIKFVGDILSRYRSKFPSAELQLIAGTGTFSRGRALHNGVAHLAPNELIFICDVDMKITSPFLERCRSNTILGKRVYFPEFFKLYNMDYVYWNTGRPKYFHLKRAHGHWAHYSFGMLCMYKADYSSVGGMDTNIEGWGDEDVQFFNKVIRSRLDILRAPDTSLSHRWHEKLCPKSLSPNQHKHCLSSQQENLADRKELARYIQEKGFAIKGSGGVVDLANNATADYEQDYNYG